MAFPRVSGQSNAPLHLPPASSIQATARGRILKTMLSGGQVQAVVMLRASLGTCLIETFLISMLSSSMATSHLLFKSHAFQQINKTRLGAQIVPFRLDFQKNYSHV